MMVTDVRGQHYEILLFVTVMMAMMVVVVTVIRWAIVMVATVMMTPVMTSSGHFA